MSSANSLARPSGDRPMPISRSWGLTLVRGLTEGAEVVACMGCLRGLSTITACSVTPVTVRNPRARLRPTSAAFSPTDGAAVSPGEDAGRARPAPPRPAGRPPARPDVGSVRHRDAAFGHPFGQHLERLLGRLPAQAGVGDAAAVGERLADHQVFPAGN